jgi:Flp pilus assembly protein TadD
MSPGNYDAHYLLGVACMQLGELAEARRALERALAIHPLSVEALHDLGLLSARQGRVAEAAEYFRRALAIDPNEERCREALRQLGLGGP